VDMLPAGAGRAVNVDAQILLLDLDIDLVIDDGIDADGAEAGMPPRVGIKGRDADKSMHAALGLEPAIGVFARNLDGDGFYPRLFARAFFQHRHLMPVLIGPAHIHAKEYLRPVLRFRAARARVNFKIAVI